MENKEKIEERILQIISYIDQDKMLQPLVGSIKLFSLEELLQLKNFLESGDYKPIYVLLDKKIKEYLNIIEEIKQIKLSKKITNIKQKEQEENKNEQVNIDTLIA